MSILVIVLMAVVAVYFFRRSFMRTKLRMDTEVRDVI